MKVRKSTELNKGVPIYVVERNARPYMYKCQQEYNLSRYAQPDAAFNASEVRRLMVGYTFVTRNDFTDSPDERTMISDHYWDLYKTIHPGGRTSKTQFSLFDIRNHWELIPEEVRIILNVMISSTLERITPVALAPGYASFRLILDTKDGKMGFRDFYTTDLNPSRRGSAIREKTVTKNVESLRVNKRRMPFTWQDVFAEGFAGKVKIYIERMESERIWGKIGSLWPAEHFCDALKKLIVFAQYYINDQTSDMQKTLDELSTLQNDCKTYTRKYTKRKLGLIHKLPELEGAFENLLETRRPGNKRDLQDAICMGLSLSAQRQGAIMKAVIAPIGDNGEPDRSACHGSNPLVPVFKQDDQWITEVTPCAVKYIKRHSFYQVRSELTECLNELADKWPGQRVYPLEEIPEKAWSAYNRKVYAKALGISLKQAPCHRDLRSAVITFATQHQSEIGGERALKMLANNSSQSSLETQEGYVRSIESEGSVALTKIHELAKRQRTTQEARHDFQVVQ